MSHKKNRRREIEQGLPLVTCAPWCEKGDGHPGESCVEDQWCSSEDSTVSLTLEYMIGERAKPESWTLDYMSACLIKDTLHTAPHVHLGRNEDGGVKLTVDEARRLGEVLVDLARLAEK